MHVFFEDDGAFRAGTVLADNETSLQVETSTGKRQKVKAANVLLRFPLPAPAALLDEANRLAEELEPDFLWEVSGADEFAFTELAEEYHGRAPKPQEAAAFALKLHASPMHFYKRGKGRYRKAPPDALRAALASIERKRLEAEQIEKWVAELAARRLPDPLRAVLSQLLYAPDRRSLEQRALEQACERLRTNPVKLLQECGAIPSSHDFHFHRFLYQAFPRGTDFPAFGELSPLPELPRADVHAFTIDDATTTEFDDAFSVTPRADGGHRIGVHIAAPALGIVRGSPLDAIARNRLSTVYLPGHKITMLPGPVIDAFSLAAGRECPALSMYVDVDADGLVVGQSCAVDRVPIAENLRLGDLDDRFASSEGPTGDRVQDALAVLWTLAQSLEAARGREETERVDFSFHVDWDRAPDGHVTIVPRPRGSPLDRLVAELMIHVNASWGKQLADARWPGMFRTQQAGKVRMSTRPELHQGLGVSHYLWASSPLRRFSDLANQRQLLALMAGGKPAYAEGDPELFAAVADFEVTYASYAEIQTRMEYYWCLRWLLQQRATEARATVIRENLVRLRDLPIVTRIADLPALPPDAPVVLAVGAIDLLACTLELRFARPAA